MCLVYTYMHFYTHVYNSCNCHCKFTRFCDNHVSFIIFVQLIIKYSHKIIHFRYCSVNTLGGVGAFCFRTIIHRSLFRHSRSLTSDFLILFIFAY